MAELRIDPDRLDYATAVRKFAQARPGYAAEADRDAEPVGWAELTGQLGAVAAGIPEAHGGAGGGLLDWCLVASELGRELAVGAFVPTVVAADAVFRLGGEQERASLLPAMAAGETRVALALSTFGSGPQLRLDDAATGPTVTGTARAVLDPRRSAHVLAVARSEADGVSRVVLAALSPQHVRIGDEAPLDPTRPCADLTLDGAECRVLVGADGSDDGPDSVKVTALLLLAVDLVGVAERALELATEYALARHQFGRPIGSFQAVKHRLADVAVETDLASAAVLHVASTAAEAASDLPRTARLAWAQASEAATQATSAAMQVFGGMGFTWEAPVHHYLRRARSSRAVGERPSLARREAFGRTLDFSAGVRP